MAAERVMYRWRQMTPELRKQALESRKSQRVPSHGPPHRVGDASLYLLTAACYEHKPIVGFTPERMADFESELLESLGPLTAKIFAWNLLPNHYHVLVETPNIKALMKAIRPLHGRTSFRWNGEEGVRQRKVWHCAAETEMKSEGHFWATFNYVMHNAVRHGYVNRWQDWPYSNAEQYVNEVGREAAERRWCAYPLLDYGKSWDPPEL